MLFRSIVTYGMMINEALEAARDIEDMGFSAEVIKLGRISPLVLTEVFKSLEKTGRLVVCEDVCAAGCIGERILAEAALNNVRLLGARLLNLGEGIVTHGEVSELRKLCGIDSDSIVKAALSVQGGASRGCAAI